MDELEGHVKQGNNMIRHGLKRDKLSTPVYNLYA